MKTTGLLCHGQGRMKNYTLTGDRRTQIKRRLLGIFGSGILVVKIGGFQHTSR